MDTKDETKMPQTKRSYVCRTYILRAVGIGEGGSDPDFGRSRGRGEIMATTFLPALSDS